MGGSAPFERWAGVFTGRSRQLPNDLAAVLEVADLSYELPNGGLLSNFRARADWFGDRLRVREATAEIDGTPMPRLNLSISGIGRFLDSFASRPERRRMPRATEDLPGVRPMWEIFRPKETEEPRAQPPSFVFEADRLHARVFIWPR